MVVVEDLAEAAEVEVAAAGWVAEEVVEAAAVLVAQAEAAGPAEPTITPTQHPQPGSVTAG